MIKSRPIVSITRNQKSGGATTAVAASLITNTMKRFIVFIILLSLLIVGEYYFLTEVITQKRIWVIAGSLLVSIICLYFLFRFYKRSVFSSRSTSS